MTTNLVAARNMRERGSCRTGIADWTIDGNTVIAVHFITGSAMGTIDLASGSIVAERPRFEAALANILAHIEEHARKQDAQMELERLQHYPIRNAAAIAKLQNN